MLQAITSGRRSSKTWRGDVFYPGCYAGDRHRNVMLVGMATDVKLHKENRGKVRERMEALVARTSFVYENQLNVELRIARLVIYKDKGRN
eukprot:1175155-Amphidinium_carterae.1